MDFNCEWFLRIPGLIHLCVFSFSTFLIVIHVTRMQIISNAWKHQQSSGALLNYIDLDPSKTFEDAAGTALLAAGTFRLAALVFGTSNAPYVNVAAAEKGREWVIAQIGSDGWLRNVVDPYDWHKEQSAGQSPEGQSFVLMLQAAYRDWYTTTQGYY